jgi:hypothetical protein
MRFFTALLMLSAALLLTACAQYTEKTSPCFDRSGEPVVSRATISFAAAAPVSGANGNDCTFEALPRPE